MLCREGEQDTADQLLVQEVSCRQDDGGRLGEQQQVVWRDHLNQGAESDQQRHGHRCEAIHRAGPARRAVTVGDGIQALSAAQREQGAAADQIQPGPRMGAMRHVEDQTMAKRQQSDQGQQGGDNPGSQKQATASKGRRTEQQKQENGDGEIASRCRKRRSKLQSANAESGQITDLQSEPFGPWQSSSRVGRQASE